MAANQRAMEGAGHPVVLNFVGNENAGGYSAQGSNDYNGLAHTCAAEAFLLIGFLTAGH